MISYLLPGDHQWQLQELVGVQNKTLEIAKQLELSGNLMPLSRF